MPFQTPGSHLFEMTLSRRIAPLPPGFYLPELNLRGGLQKYHHLPWNMWEYWAICQHWTFYRGSFLHICCALNFANQFFVYQHNSVRKYITIKTSPPWYLIKIWPKKSSISLFASSFFFFPLIFSLPASNVSKPQN